MFCIVKASVRNCDKPQVKPPLQFEKRCDVSNTLSGPTHSITKIRKLDQGTKIMRSLAVSAHQSSFYQSVIPHSPHLHHPRDDLPVSPAYSLISTYTPLWLLDSAASLLYTLSPHTGVQQLPQWPKCYSRTASVETRRFIDKPDDHFDVLVPT